METLNKQNERFKKNLFKVSKVILSIMQVITLSLFTIRTVTFITAGLTILFAPEFAETLATYLNNPELIFAEFSLFILMLITNFVYECSYFNFLNNRYNIYQDNNYSVWDL